MQAPPLPPDETQRLAALHALDILDTAADATLDRVTRTAARLFRVPVALVSLIDAERQWFKSRVGLDVAETPRELSFCGHAILADATLVVEDAAADPRFCGNPLVDGGPRIAFYAGHPLHSRDGHRLGTLCLIDHVPRRFDEDDVAALVDLAKLAERHLHGLHARDQARAMHHTLTRTEALFESTFSQAAVGMAITSLDGRWLRVNERLSEITGYPRDALLARRFHDITHPDDLADDLGQLERLIAGALPHYALEKRYLRADGGTIWVALSVSLVRDDDGAPLYLVAVVEDIDARKRMEAELQRAHRELEARVAERTADLASANLELSREIHERERYQRWLAEEEARFRTILANATDAFVAVDEAGTIVEWNRSAERIFGWSRDEAVGRPLADTIIPDTMRAAHHAGFTRFCASGEGRILDQRIELPARRRDGSEFPTELTLSANHLGGRRIVSAFLHDISERKAAETALRDSRERLRLITDHMPALIAYVDKGLRYRFNNRAYQHWFGVSPESLAGTEFRALLGEAAFARTHDAIARLSRGEPVHFEEVIDCRLGRLDVHTTLVPNRTAAGDFDGFYVLALDITERKRLMARLEAEASLDALTGLPNRRAFMRHLGRAIALARRARRGLALLFIDLDGFKRLNDDHGHDFGDAVLRRLAALLAGTLRQTDVVSRLAGDEFTVILEQLEAPAITAPAVADKLLAALAQVDEIDGRPVRLSASIGVALYPHNAQASPEALLAAADRAMYRAKQSGKNRYALCSADG
ncbi:PAS domain S-box-containing protein/diguanylate cyclase (GGDEF)-like protein [Crenobacter luteus]|uniref:PAS domain S-box protein n=1 Tax=Crenobacter luteus TaxID=1452487 RepID=UPI001046DDFF|nr:PAS domain S-box protein [Crenobacter luteus]TCP15193.1 PAS domain S-box-containing protein/diguanylate cyclase (GGDEF)-like protein [Crenobacter luteus]